MYPQGSTYTIEAWVYMTSTTGTQYIYACNATNTANFGIVGLNVASGVPTFEVRPTTGGSVVALSGGSVKTNEWTHIAASVNSGSARLFVNGALVSGPTTVSSATFTPTGFGMGYLQNGFTTGVTAFNGYIGGFRLTQSGALYTAAFTPPTSAFTTTVSSGTVSLLLNFTNGGIIDATGKNVLETVGNAQISTTQSKFGGSSMYFDGTGDYITSVANTGLALGSGDFTVEMWLYPTAFATYKTIWGCTSAVNVTTGFHVGANASGQMFIYSNSAFRISSSANSGVLTLNQWNYLAIVRSSGVVRIYVNGVVATSTWSTTQDFSQGYNVIGAAPGGGSEYFTGYIDDLRITKGVARTVTTSPTSAFALQ